jgi:glycosyltransferase involved in cell wall biosynthesis
MKLMFVHEVFGAMAGAESNLFHTASELKARGHQVALLHGPGTGKAEKAWSELFVKKYVLGSDDQANAAFSALSDFDPDLVYVHKMAELPVLEVLATCGTPVVRMVHDHEMYCMKGYKYHTFTREICTRALSPCCVFPCGGSLKRNRSDGFPIQWVSYTGKRKELDLNQQFHRMIVATDYMRQELLRNAFAADKIEIHAPVPPDSNHALQSSFSERNLLLYAGQITRGKGVDVLLESLAMVQAPFECVILGDGHHRGHCEELSRKLGIADSVHFEGYVPQALMTGYYQEATAMVMSSVWPEPFGAVGLEAMRHGLPVIAFDAGGVKEWLTDGHDGFLVPWMDRAAYADRVERLLMNKNLARQMGERARLGANERYNFSRYVDGLEQSFARTVRQPREEVFA